VFAWTLPLSDVSVSAYVSLNSTPEGHYEITVRSGPEAGSMCAWATLPRQGLRALRDAINAELRRDDPDPWDPTEWPFGRCEAYVIVASPDAEPAHSRCTLWLGHKGLCEFGRPEVLRP
jgi:hypothetical protein